MYGVAGERRLPELELDWLPGFANSRPVRIGNAASGQRQLDVVGEVIDALYQARLAGIEIDDNAWNIQLKLLEWLEANWRLPDQGIWEVRSGPANFTFSKVMCWVAFDRAIAAVEDNGMPGHADRWRQLRQQIETDVCERAVDAGGHFVQSYEHHVLDAATLAIPLVGFLPPDDPRVVATVEAVARGLSVGGLIRRYQADDGLPGSEGAFLLCSFWLVDCYELMGRHDEATAQFERLLSIANDVGLLAEEYDPATGRQLGNFPQAFSHLALVSSAMMLSPTHAGPNQDRSTTSRRRRKRPQAVQES
jgi:GH15 family glucan-1,4-alpha-glucosidase